MTEMFSIDSRTHFDRIFNLVRCRENPDQVPKHPGKRRKFVAVTCGMKQLLQHQRRQMTALDLLYRIESSLKTRYTSEEFNAILLAIARFLRKELRMARMVDEKRRNRVSTRRPRSLPTPQLKESTC
jgi:hypothetical protein